MKILVTSDVHGSVERIREIEKNNDCDFYLDCGDSELTKFQLGSFITVKGNCDMEDYPKFRIIKVNDNIKIFMTHGHRYTKDQMIKIAKSEECNIVLYGHTHVKNLEKIDDIYFVNPGSVSRPRRGNPKTFLLITNLENSKDIDFKFVKINL